MIDQGCGARPNAALNLRDGDGIFLLAQPNGARYWRLKCLCAEKEKLLDAGNDPSNATRHH